MVRKGSEKVGNGQKMVWNTQEMAQNCKKWSEIVGNAQYGLKIVQDGPS